MTALRTLANGKINLCLLLGQQRPDGYHDVVSVIQPLELADVVTLEDSQSGIDEVICPGVEGDNLAARAIAAWRAETGVADQPVRVTIEKHVPVAAGMGGGSADAAAVLRLLEARFGRDGSVCAGSLGADVPPLLMGGTTIVHGIGDRVAAAPQPEFGSAVILPSTAGLSTPVVFNEAGEMGMRRRPTDIVQVLTQLDHAAKAGPGWELPDALLGLNDLGPAAARLEPSVGAALEEARGVGADQAYVTGSGPTVVALFHGESAEARAEAAQESLSARPGGAIFTRPAAASATIEEVS